MSDDESTDNDYSPGDCLCCGCLLESTGNCQLGCITCWRGHTRFAMDAECNECIQEDTCQNCKTYEFYSSGNCSKCKFCICCSDLLSTDETDLCSECSGEQV